MIVPDIAEYEETDSNLARLTILRLHEEINRLKNELEQQNIEMGLYSEKDTSQAEYGPSQKVKWRRGAGLKIWCG